MSGPMTNYARKYMLKVLAQLAKELGHAEDCIATLTHSGCVNQFIRHACIGKDVDGLHEVAQAGHSDAAIELARLIAQADNHIGAPELWVDYFLQTLQQSSVIVQGRNAVDQLSLHDWISKLDGVGIGYTLKYARKVIRASSLDAAHLSRRLARVGSIQLTPETGLAVWAYANAQGSDRRISLDVTHAAGFFSLEIPTGLAPQLEKLLRAGAYMAEVAGEMSTEEWAKYEAAERAASVPARTEGAAV